MAALSGSRRQLDFGLFDEVPLPGALETRTAARKWAESKGIFVGCFSQPQLTPDDKEVTTARCGECSDCWQGLGTVYRFVVEVVEQITKVRVYKAAQCSGPARTARAAPKHKEDNISNLWALSPYRFHYSFFSSGGSFDFFSMHLSYCCEPTHAGRIDSC